MRKEAEPLNTLQGWSLLFARTSWAVIAICVAGIALASWPVYQRLLFAFCESCPITPAYQSILLNEGLNPERWAQFQLFRSVFIQLVWFGIGVLIFLLKSTDRRAILFSSLLIVISASFGGVLGEIAGTSAAWSQIHAVINFVSFPCFIGLIYLFPSGVFQPRGLAWLLLGLSLLFIPASVEIPSLPIAYNFLVIIIFLASGVIVPVYRYRRVMTYSERQQTKWVLFGIVLAMTGVAITITLVGLGPEPCDQPNLYCDVVQNLGYSLSPLMIPIFIGIGILRSKLWDIDIIIRRTLQYTLLTGLLALVYFGSVVLLQTLVENLTGQQSPIVIVISTLAIAALFNPLRIRTQDFIDRRFFRKKYDAEQTLANFAAVTRDEVDMDKLTAALLGVVEKTMQPEKVSLWLPPVARLRPARIVTRDQDGNAESGLDL